MDKKRAIRSCNLTLVAVSDLFLYHRWSVPPPASPSLSILQAHLTHKRNFSVFDPSNNSRLLRKNTHVLSPQSSSNLKSDPSRLFNSIVLPNMVSGCEGSQGRPKIHTIHSIYPPLPPSPPYRSPTPSLFIPLPQSLSTSLASLNLFIL